MLSIDVPSTFFIGLVLAEGAKEIVKKGDSTNVTRGFVALYTAITFTPIPLIFLLGWPAWQTAYLWEWVDKIPNNGYLALLTVAIFFLLTLVPALVGFEVGRTFINRGQEKWVRHTCIATAVAVALLVYLTRERVFYVASSYGDYLARDFTTIFDGSFFACWMFTFVWTWLPLPFAYRFLSKRDSLTG